MLGPYLALLRTRRVGPLLLSVGLSAIPLGMLSLTLVLAVQEWTGELRAAGTIAALFGAGNAVALAAQGAWMDRGRPRTVIVSAGSCSALALVGVAAAGSLGGPLWLIGSAALVAGVSVPAITTATRAWFSRAAELASRRRSGYALLAATFSGAVAVGPAAVSLSVLISGPTVALMVAAALIAAATSVFALSFPPGASAGPEEPDPDGAPPARERSGPLASAGLRTILVAAGLDGVATGMIGVAVPGVMTAAGMPALAGIGFAALAVGEVCGSTLFGARRWPGSRRGQLPVVIAALALAAAMMWASAGTPWLLVAAMAAAGAASGPRAVLSSTMLDDVVRPDGIARAYSSLVAVGLLCGSAGNYVAGQLAEPLGVSGLLLIPPGLLGAAACWTLARRRTLG